MSDASRVVDAPPPSTRRRLLAVVSLVATVVLLVLVLVFLLKNPLWFVGGGDRSCAGRRWRVGDDH
ncbi:MAG: hypothetical protein WCP28_06150 [Actinomycetes bacterium]